MKKTMYAVWGKNGFGMFDDYEFAMKQKEFVIAFRIKKMPSYEEACNYAIDNYNDLQSLFDDSIYHGKAILKRNWIYYKNQIRKGGH